MGLIYNNTFTSSVNIPFLGIATFSNEKAIIKTPGNGATPFDMSKSPLIAKEIKTLGNGATPFDFFIKRV